MNVQLASRHALQRMNQRAISAHDVDLVLEYGTAVAGDSILLLDADIDREIANRKREIQRLERLRRCKIVLKDNLLVTCYRASKKQEKRILRRSRLK